MDGRKARVIEGAKSILKTRGFKVTNETTSEGFFDIIGKSKEKGSIVVRIPDKPVVGVQYVRDFLEHIEQKKYNNAILLALTKYTHYAKKEAKQANIETFSVKFPFFDLFEHYLVPKHEIASEDEVVVLEKKYSIKKHQLPKISLDDPAVQLLGAKVGDVLKIDRDSPTAGDFTVFRTVIP